MAIKKVICMHGQSNMDGFAAIATLPAALRGAQANRFIWNHENNAVETLNCDGVGANLPNNTCDHRPGFCGPELALAESAVADLGEVFIFKWAMHATVLGPSKDFRSWNFEDNDLFADLVTRWNAFKVAMAGLGHTIDVIMVAWAQGDGDWAIEGNDLAYFGLFRRFINEVMKLYRPFSQKPSEIKWVTALTHQVVVPPSLWYWVSPQKNVRAAQRRAGWDNPHYRILDADDYSYTGVGAIPGDFIHLDTAGVVAEGHDFWNAFNLSYNNSMALEDYNLISLRTKLAAEFGIDLTVQTNINELDSRINDALTWIGNRRKNWHWLDADVDINVGERTLVVNDIRRGSAIFFQHQDSAINAIFNLSASEPRELLSFDGAGAQGLLVKAITGAVGLQNLVFPHRYRGDAQDCPIIQITIGNPTIIKINRTSLQGGTATIPNIPGVATFGARVNNSQLSVAGFAMNNTYMATRISDDTFSIPFDSSGNAVVVLGDVMIAKEFTVIQGHFELPEDFIKENTLHLESEPDETMMYKTPQIFERQLRAIRAATPVNRIFTVRPDPIGLSSRRYLSVFPYFTRRDLMRMKYFRHIRKLVGDLDVPDVPIAERAVVLYACQWFTAQWQKELEMIPVYRDGALNELERMGGETQFSDDTTESQDDPEPHLGPIRGPSGFPQFEEP